MSWEKHLKPLFSGDDKRVAIGGVPTSAWGYVGFLVATEAFKGLKKGAAKTLLIVCPEPNMVDDVTEGLGVLLPGMPVLEFPAWDVQPYDRLGPNAEVAAQRLMVVGRVKDSACVVVTSVNALGVRLPPVGGTPLQLAVDMVQAPEAVAEKLVALGYELMVQVDAMGQFARRGGVLDVWPAASENPLRVEWFDDEIESIRPFDAATQTSTPGAGAKVWHIAPVRDAVLDEARMGVFRKQYREAFGADAVDDEAYVMVSAGQMPPYGAQMLPLFYEEDLPTLFDALPESAVVVVPENLNELADLWEETVQDAYKARAGDETMRAVEPARLCVSASELMGGLGQWPQVAINRFADAKMVDAGLREHAWNITSRGNRHAAAQAAGKEIARRVGEGWSIVLTAQTEPALEQMARALEAEGVPPVVRDDECLRLYKPGVAAAIAPFAAGWVDSAARRMVVAEGDVFGRKINSGPRRKRRSPEEIIAHFSELRDGDFVVHEQHGIGKFAGLVTLDLGTGTRQDFLRLVYAGDDRLLVPVANLDTLSRYKGGETVGVTLDRLGTGGWEARKEKVRVDLLEMADDLIKIAAARELVQRDPVVKVDGLYDEFCAGFPYDLTDDQAQVMEEVEADFAGGVPMDRLVVGDVGFGKTEVALRAAFMMAAAGRQVAIVCPTTLLARQHMDVFRNRFAGFPMQVGGLSRLVNAAETRRVKAGLINGEIDIVVGTHALLSADVKFKNLGLMVVDEEQRFGVAHKERLKEKKAACDVLTLTATPIPRTLQMAMGGVRQLSLIATPPVDRRAVQTHVLAWDNQTLREAIRREIGRGGQVYVVAPHIEDLAVLEDDIRALVPEARLGVAHGQMGEMDLEKIMVDFYSGEMDVLLATTIIESGLDVPKANTLIVYRADRFGLSQLYQLRGRVGRSTARAFAYFILPPHVGVEAGKRLEILQRLEGLGAGFTLASYDMDMRGFGNLLGKQQSGHIRDIGFELYAKMLRDAVTAKRKRIAEGLKNEMADEPEPMNVSLKLGVTYLIPENYVADAAVRLQLYRRLANLQAAEELAAFRLEMADRFGAVPTEVERLLDVMDLRNRAGKLNISKLEVGERGVVVSFHKGAFAAAERLMTYIMKNAGVMQIRQEKDGNQSLVWHKPIPNGDAQLKVVAWVVKELEGLLIPEE